MRVNLAQTITRLKSGEVVAIPTETVYGLAADARNESAIKKIYEIKERPASNPLIVHISDINQVNDWASEFSSLAKTLAEAFWPGPFTLVLPARANVPQSVRAGEPTVALRMPAHAITRQVLQESGLALAAPSANKYTQLSPTTADHVEQSLGQDIAVLDGGACAVGIESTIIFVKYNQWHLLRTGMISEAQIKAVAKCSASKPQQTVPKAPGQHLLHYSPRTSIRLFDSNESLAIFAEKQKSYAALVFGESKLRKDNVFTLSLDPAAAAGALYGTLHQMDDLAVETLLVVMPPNQPQWLAIRDRLSRASHKLN